MKDYYDLYFIYGNNGTGKTTITRVIENPSKYEDYNYCGMTVLNVINGISKIEDHQHNNSIKNL